MALPCVTTEVGLVGWFDDGLANWQWAAPSSGCQRHAFFCKPPWAKPDIRCALDWMHVLLERIWAAVAVVRSTPAGNAKREFGTLASLCFLGFVHSSPCRSLS